jgi:predicted acylesterase/phospholipase RssA
MTIALVLGGGAPNLTPMAGAVAALDDAGVEFDIVSTSGGPLLGVAACISCWVIDGALHRAGSWALQESVALR